MRYKHLIIGAFGSLALVACIYTVFYFINHGQRPDTELQAFDSGSLLTSVDANTRADGLLPTPVPPLPDGSKDTAAIAAAKAEAESYTKELKKLKKKLDKKLEKGKEGEDYLTVCGTKFPIRDSFLPTSGLSYNWYGYGEYLEALSDILSGSLTPSTILWFDSETIEFSHNGVGFDGIRLTYDDTNYKLRLNVPLAGSASSDQNADVLKAFLSLFSSTPLELYEAITDSYLTDNSHKLNTEKYTSIGDSKIKVKLSDGAVTYLIHAKNQ